jgi:hypothetical protein
MRKLLAASLATLVLAGTAPAQVGPLMPTGCNPTTDPVPFQTSYLYDPCSDTDPNAIEWAFSRYDPVHAYCTPAGRPSAPCTFSCWAEVWDVTVDPPTLIGLPDKVKPWFQIGCNTNGTWNGCMHYFCLDVPAHRDVMASHHTLASSGSGVINADEAYNYTVSTAAPIRASTAPERGAFSIAAAVSGLAAGSLFTAIQVPWVRTPITVNRNVDVPAEHRLGQHGWNTVVFKNRVPLDAANSVTGKGGVRFDFDASVFTKRPMPSYFELTVSDGPAVVARRRYPLFVLDHGEVRKDHFEWFAPLPPGVYRVKAELIWDQPGVNKAGEVVAASFPLGSITWVSRVTDK